MPKIKITNQKPVTIYNPDHMLTKINPNLDPIDYEQKVKDKLLKQLVTPLYTPNIQNVSVTIDDVTDASNVQSINDQQVLMALLDLWEIGTLDPELDAQVNEIYRQSLLNYQVNNWIIEKQLAIEAMSSVNPKLPIPGMSNLILQYTANGDLIPAAKTLLSQANSYNKTMWFASLAGYLSAKNISDSLIVTFQSTAAFNMYKDVVKLLVSNANATAKVTTDTNKLFNELTAIKFDGLSETIMLPNDDVENKTENSFVRLFMNSLALFEGSNNDLFSVQPINMAQLFFPTNVIMLNLDSYAHASGKEINKDWASIEKAININNNMKFATNKQLTTAKSINASTQKIAHTRQKINKQNQIMRLKQKRFSGKPIPAASVLKAMAAIAQNAITNKQTENVYKVNTPSFMRPNRRQPDNPNLMGKVTSIKYRPDIHMYIDTSGSITEPQYRDSVVNAIMLAKKIEANLFITSFSHVVSQTSLLKTKGRSTHQIYADFLNIKKVTGGTDYMNVWQKINKIDKLNKRTGKSYQLNFIVSDFEYNLPRGFTFDPKSPCVTNTYYAPISTSKHTWKHIMHYAESFKTQMMKANDPNIRARMLL